MASYLSKVSWAIAVVASVGTASAQEYRDDYSAEDARFAAKVDFHLREACPNPAPHQSDPTLKQCWQGIVYQAFQLARDYSNFIVRQEDVIPNFLEYNDVTLREHRLLGICEEMAQTAWQAPFNPYNPQLFTTQAADAALYCMNARDAISESLGERNVGARNHVADQLNCIGSTVKREVPCNRPNFGQRL